jgi:phage-related holin
MRSYFHLAASAPALQASLLGSMAASLLVPVVPLLVLCVAFIVVDFVLGLIVSIKKRRVGFQSERAWQSVYKLAGSLVVVVLSYHLEHTLLVTDHCYLARCVTAIICSFDLWSILSNFALLSNHPMFRYLKRFLKSEMESKINRMKGEK